MTTDDLLSEINAETVRRSTAGCPVLAIRLHPETFAKVVIDLDARTWRSGVHGQMEAILNTPAGVVRLRPGPDAPVRGHPYFDPPM